MVFVIHDKLSTGSTRHNILPVGRTGIVCNQLGIFFMDSVIILPNLDGWMDISLDIAGRLKYFLSVMCLFLSERERK